MAIPRREMWGSGRTIIYFPNPGRSYEEREHGVRFLGFLRTTKVSFLIDEAALLKINSKTKADEAEFLSTFDVNRDQSHKVAY